jgi:hypothetical protein
LEKDFLGSRSISRVDVLVMEREKRIDLARYPRWIDTMRSRELEGERHYFNATLSGPSPQINVTMAISA